MVFPVNVHRKKKALENRYLKYLHRHRENKREKACSVKGILIENWTDRDATWVFQIQLITHLINSHCFLYLRVLYCGSTPTFS